MSRVQLFRGWCNSASPAVARGAATRSGVCTGFAQGQPGKEGTTHSPRTDERLRQRKQHKLKQHPDCPYLD